MKPGKRKSGTVNGLSRGCASGLAKNLALMTFRCDWDSLGVSDACFPGSVFGTIECSLVATFINANGVYSGSKASQIVDAGINHRKLKNKPN